MNDVATSMVQALGYLKAVIQQRQHNLTVNRDYVLRRIATKIVRATKRLGRMPSPGAQAVTRCNGVLRYEFGKLVVETGQLAVVEAIPETWRAERKELVN